MPGFDELQKRLLITKARTVTAAEIAARKTSGSKLSKYDAFNQSRAFSLIPTKFITPSAGYQIELVSGHTADIRVTSNTYWFVLPQFDPNPPYNPIDGITLTFGRIVFQFDYEASQDFILTDFLRDWTQIYNPSNTNLYGASSIIPFIKWREGTIVHKYSLMQTAEPSNPSDLIWRNKIYPYYNGEIIKKKFSIELRGYAINPYTAGWVPQLSWTTNILTQPNSYSQTEVTFKHINAFQYDQLGFTMPMTFTAGNATQANVPYVSN